MKHKTDEEYDGMILLDGLEDAMLGVSQDNRAVYSYDKAVQIFMDRDGMDEEEATEWVDYNILGFCLDRAPYPVIVFPYF